MFTITKRVKQDLELLKRHIIILKKVMSCGPIGILKISLETGIPDHKVRYSLRVLEQHGLILPSPHGAIASQSAKDSFFELKLEFDKIYETILEIKQEGSDNA